MLKVRDLKVHYGKIEALKGVSLDIEDGEFVTIIGSNGAGNNDESYYNYHILCKAILSSH